MSTHNEAGRVVKEAAEPDGEAATKHVTVLWHTHAHPAVNQTSTTSMWRPHADRC